MNKYNSRWSYIISVGFFFNYNSNAIYNDKSKHDYWEVEAENGRRREKQLLIILLSAK